MKNYSLTVHCGGETRVLCADGEKSILESLGTAHISVDAPCGGRGVCRKCTVELKGILRAFEGNNIIEADGEVLACRYAPAGDCEVWLAPEEELRIATGEKSTIAGGGEGLGLAIDIGTTTVVSALYDLGTGECLGEKSELNAQRGFGADVISRIEHCRKGSFEDICECTAKQLSQLGEKDNITRVSIVGNTVMEHLAAGLDPTPLAVPPFTVRSLFGEAVKSAVWPEAEVYFARCVSAYVGGDVLAGMYACDMQNAEGLQLYVDMGTNGEIAMGNREGYVTCATAAGPAFEGAEISCGMHAAKGAVDRVWTENGEIFIHVIGGGRAKGICGSGLIDAVAVMLELGIVGKSGRLMSIDKYADRYTVIDGAKSFAIAEGVYLTAHDIRKVQLAKAAIRAGIETLLGGREITGLTVAGGFGKYINIRSAVKIGLLPHVSEDIINQGGNAAAKGAVLLLEKGRKEELMSLAERCSYHDLSSSAEFSKNYIDYLNFR